MEISIKYESFTELTVWQEARKFQLFIFNLTKSFPSEEKFRLSDQIIRASRSITSNIAEGHGRYHYQEQIQFCRAARGSLSEVLNHTYTALDCNYITDEQVKEIEQKYQLILKLLNGYIAYLKKQKLNLPNQLNQPNQPN
ncbi:MAG: four helix bundle protein [Flavisolibacter sp.]